MRNVSGFWNWTDRVLVPNLYNTTWYNGKPFSYEEGFLRNKDLYLVGMPRIRQLRIKTGVETFIVLLDKLFYVLF